MKTEIHPKYFTDAKITCACGAIFSIAGTKDDVHVEICSQCHPFYTGNEKVLDTAGRVDKFKKRKALSATKAKK
jgi:large subunit ribosomal protein L31